MRRADGLAVLAFIVLGASLAAPFTWGDLAFFPFHTGIKAPWSATAPEWVKDEPDNENVGDKYNIIYPDLIYTRQELEQRHVPLWNSYNYAGLPHEANPLTATFYPINAMLLWMDPIRSLGVSMAIHVFLAGLFAYLFLRAIRVRPGAAFAGGLALAFSGWIAVHLHHTYFVQSFVWVPLALFAVEHLLRGRPRWALMVYALSIACMVLGGFAQTAVIGAYLIGIYTLAGLLTGMRRRGGHDTLRLAGLIAAFTVLGFLLALVQLAPTLSFSGDVGHQDIPLERLEADGLRPITLLHLLVPDLFGNPQDLKAPQQNFLTLWLLADGRPTGHIANNYSERSFYPGVLVLLLALAAPFLRRDRVTLTLSAAGVASVLLAIGTPLLDLAVHLPYLDFGSPMRFTQVAALALPLLFAITLDRLLASAGGGVPRRFKRTILLGVALIALPVVGLLALWTAPSWVTNQVTDSLVAHGIDAELGAGDVPLAQKRDMMRPHVLELRRVLSIAFVFFLGAWAVLILATHGRAPPYAVLALAIAVTAAELLWYGVRFNLPVRREGLFEARSAGIRFLRNHQGDTRFIRYGPEDTTSFFTPNVPLAYGLRDAQGYRAMTPRSYLEFMRTLEPNPHDHGLLNLGRPESLLRPQLALLRVRHVISAKPRPELPLKQVYPAADATGPVDMYVYENPVILPRAFLMHPTEVHVLPPEEMLAEFSRLPPRSPEEAADPVFAREIWFNELPYGMKTRYPQPDGTEELRVLVDEPGHLAFELDVEKEGLLVLSEQFASGWKAWAWLDEDGLVRREIPILRANHTFMAAPFAPDATRIVLRYDPDSFKWGGLLSGLSLCFLLLVPLMTFLAPSSRHRYAPPERHG